MDLLRHGENVEVLEPVELRQAVVERVQAMQALYSGTKSDDRLIPLSSSVSHTVLHFIATPEPSMSIGTIIEGENVNPATPAVEPSATIANQTRGEQSLYVSEPGMFSVLGRDPRGHPLHPAAQLSRVAKAGLRAHRPALNSATASTSNCLPAFPRPLAEREGEPD